MVDEGGQFYTMEGIAAAILMVITASVVLTTTTVYTPGDTHIQDMQLEQLGYDALKAMDTPDSFSANLLEPDSDLEKYIRNWDVKGFHNDFRRYIDITGGPGTLQYSASIFYVNTSGVIMEKKFNESKPYSGRENAVRVSRWVFVNKGSGNVYSNLTGMDSSYNHTVLLEVLMWRE